MEKQMNVRNDGSQREFGSIVAAWRQLRSRTRIGVIQSKSEYENMVDLLNKLVDKIGDDEGHELAGLLDVVGALIKQYEDDNVSLPSLSPRARLKFLMEQNYLRQSDLREELGSQGVVSEVLSGKREINARQARALAQKFGVSPSVFL